MKEQTKQTQHTPTPWKLDEAESGGHRIFSTRNGANIAFTDEINDATLKSAGEDEANAAFIVRACNSYNRLVDTLDELIFRFGHNDSPEDLECLDRARALLADERLETEPNSKRKAYRA